MKLSRVFTFSLREPRSGATLEFNVDTLVLSEEDIVELHRQSAEMLMAQAERSVAILRNMAQRG